MLPLVLKARISTDEEVVEDVGGGAFNPVDQAYIDSLTTPAQKDRIYRRNVLTALRTFKVTHFIYLYIIWNNNWSLYPAYARR